MKKNTFRFNENNILCHRCVINAAKALSKMPQVEEFSIDVKTKMVQIIYKDDNISKEMIRNAVSSSITGEGINTIFH